MTSPVAVFVSGTGRHLENLARLARTGELAIDVRLCLSNKAGVKALDRARAANVEALVLDPERALDAAAFSEAAFAAVEERGCETVLLAGFLRLLVIPDRWLGRVLNIHPSLLPAFGGQGFYGDRVHKGVLERGCEITGCTVHYVDNEYDHGPILHQRACKVQPGDDVEALAARVFAEEELAFPEAIRRHLARA